MIQTNIVVNTGRKWEKNSFRTLMKTQSASKRRFAISKTKVLPSPTFCLMFQSSIPGIPLNSSFLPEPIPSAIRSGSTASNFRPEITSFPTISWYRSLAHKTKTVPEWGKKRRKIHQQTAGSILRTTTLGIGVRPPRDRPLLTYMRNGTGRPAGCLREEVPPPRSTNVDVGSPRPHRRSLRWIRARIVRRETLIVQRSFKVG